MKSFSTKSNVCGCAAFVFLSLSAPSLSQVSAEAPLAQILATGSLGDRSNAVGRVLTTPLEKRSSEVLPALLQELDREAARDTELWAAYVAGKPTEASGEGEGELQLTVLQIVAQYKDDERIVPYMLTFLSRSVVMMQIVADRGERTVASVLDITRSNSRPPEDVDSTLYTLRLMLQGTPKYPLSESSKKLIIAAAAQRLRGQQRFPSNVTEAIDLAIATGDQGLRERVRQLSDDPGAVSAFGMKSEHASMVQRHASMALSKVEAAK